LVSLLTVASSWIVSSYIEVTPLAGDAGVFDDPTGFAQPSQFSGLEVGL